MYYNTNDETGDTLRRSRRRTASQETIIYRLFSNDSDSSLELTASEVLNCLGPDTRGSVYEERHKQTKQIKQDLGYNV